MRTTARNSSILPIVVVLMVIVLGVFIFGNQNESTKEPLVSTSKQLNPTTVIYHVASANILYIHTVYGEMIPIPLVDEESYYYFNSNGVEYELEYESGGYSYGRHLDGCMCVINGCVIPIHEDNGQQKIQTSIKERIQDQEI